MDGEWLFYHWYPAHRRVNGPQSWFVHCGGKTYFKIKQFLGHPANSLVNIPNKLLENDISLIFYFSNRNRSNANCIDFFLEGPLDVIINPKKLHQNHFEMWLTHQLVPFTKYTNSLQNQVIMLPNKTVIHCLKSWLWENSVKKLIKDRNITGNYFLKSNLQLIPTLNLHT